MPVTRKRSVAAVAAAEATPAKMIKTEHTTDDDSSWAEKAAKLRDENTTLKLRLEKSEERARALETSIATEFCQKKLLKKSEDHVKELNQKLEAKEKELERVRSEIESSGAQSAERIRQVAQATFGIHRDVPYDEDYDYEHIVEKIKFFLEYIERDITARSDIEDLLKLHKKQSDSRALTAYQIDCNTIPIYTSYIGTIKDMAHCKNGQQHALGLLFHFVRKLRKVTPVKGRVQEEFLSYAHQLEKLDGAIIEILRRTLIDKGLWIGDIAQTGCREILRTREEMRSIHSALPCFDDSIRILMILERYSGFSEAGRACLLQKVKQVLKELDEEKREEVFQVEKIKSSLSEKDMRRERVKIEEMTKTLRQDFIKRNLGNLFCSLPTDSKRSWRCSLYGTSS